MNIQTFYRLSRLANNGPSIVHPTVVRAYENGTDYDANAGLVAFDGNVVSITTKGREALDNFGRL